MIPPRIVVDQITGGVVFGLTTAFKNRITFIHGRVDQRHVNAFSLLCVEEMPDTRVHLVGSDLSPTRLGKAAVSLAGIALVSAV